LENGLIHSLNQYNLYRLWEYKYIHPFICVNG